MPPFEGPPSYHSAPGDATAISTAPRREPAWVALGGNLGDPLATLTRAVRWLAALPDTELQAASRFHRTRAVGPPQPDYLNAVVRLSTALAPQALIAALQRLEVAAGRVRRERWGARTLDLDLLIHGRRVLSGPGLVVPHPRLAERAFVLDPLADIDPDLVHPTLGVTVAALRAGLSRSLLVAPRGGERGSTRADDLL